MFQSLVEELRYCVEGGGSRSDKSDRQHAFVGRSYDGDKKRRLRRDAREKHGYPDEGGVVFKQDIDHGRPSKPGSPGSMEKHFAKIQGQKFKYRKSHRRDVIGPKGKLPEDLQIEAVPRRRKERRKAAAVAAHGKNRLVNKLTPQSKAEPTKSVRRKLNRRKLQKRQYQQLGTDPLAKRADPRSKASVIGHKGGKAVERDLPRSMIGNERGIERAAKTSRKRGMNVIATRST